MVGNNRKTLREQGFTTILAAAYLSDDVIYLGGTHSMCGGFNPRYRVKWIDEEDPEYVFLRKGFGYITSDGEFVDSETAWSIGEKCGLIDENCQCFTKCSEDFFAMCNSEFNLMLAKQKITENYQKRREAREKQETKVYQKKNDGVK